MKEEFQSKFKRGVSLIHKFDKSLYYSISCDCGDNECGSIVEIECDDEFGIIQLHFYKDVHFDFWRYPSYEFFKFDWFRRFLYRLKKAIILAFTGEITLHGDFVLLDWLIHKKKSQKLVIISKNIRMRLQDGIINFTYRDMRFHRLQVNAYSIAQAFFNDTSQF